MKPGFNTLQFSGGAVNSDPDSSVGGAMSSVALYSNSVTWESTGITGVTLVGGAGNAAGAGQLRYTYSSPDDEDFLSWKQPGQAAFEVDHDVHAYVNEIVTLTSQDIETGGVVDPEGIIVLSIDDTLLPTADATVNVTVTEVDLGLFPDITEAQALSGLTRYRGLYIKQHVEYRQLVLPVVLQNSAAGDIIDLGWALQAKNTAMQLLTDDSIAPTGVTFFRGKSDQESRKKELADADDYYGFWIRQTVPPLTTLGSLNTGVRLAIYT